MAMMAAPFRWLMRLYWRGWVREIELAILAECRRHSLHEQTLRAYRWEIVRLRQKIDRSGNRPVKLQTALSGLKRREASEAELRG